MGDVSGTILTGPHSMTTPAAPAFDCDLTQPLIDPDCDLAPLIVAVIQEAKRQARRGDRDAIEWLLEDGQLWIDAIMDIHPDHLRRWVAGNCKPLGWKRAPKQKPHRRPQAARNAQNPRKHTPEPSQRATVKAYA